MPQPDLCLKLEAQAQAGALIFAATLRTESIESTSRNRPTPMTLLILRQSKTATPPPQRQQARREPEVPKIKSRMSWQPYPNLPALLRLIPNLYGGA